ncbi:MAG: PLP-dependent aminotransferase family protein [Actinobacteria bacterium]|nr:PLP-dependent aminotransferase family protein [Actinomycetota bacterium]
MRSTPEITLPLQLDRGAAGPLSAQLADHLRALIADGVVAPGEAVPASRALAAHLGISRGSVVVAYDQLLAEGYLSAVAGRSTVVNPQLRRVHPRQRPPSAPQPAAAGPGLDLRPGRPWVSEVAGSAWRSAWRRASAEPVDVAVPALGLDALRTAWADHLRRMRAVVRDPGQLAVTAGGREGLATLLLTLGGRRPLRVGVEEPGYPSLRRVPARFGAQVVPLPVDRHGLRVADLPVGAEAPDLLVITPSHQYPLGGSLPVDRRQALLEWARRHRVVVVEDDYDSELRYTSQPLPALAALDDPADGRVVMLGTLSKTLAPALAIGYLALPQWLVAGIAETRRDLGQPVGLVPQRAVAHYLESGALRLHTQRMRNRYRRRRAQVLSALSGVDGLRVYPMDGGLHAVVETARPEAAVVATLRAAGVEVSPLSQYWTGTGTRPGIVFGFGAVDDEELARGLAAIAAAAR